MALLMFTVWNQTLENAAIFSPRFQNVSTEQSKQVLTAMRSKVKVCLSFVDFLFALDVTRLPIATDFNYVHISHEILSKFLWVNEITQNETLHKHCVYIMSSSTWTWVSIN